MGRKGRNTMGYVIWFTGLSGSGKTTIAHELKNKLEDIGKSVEVIDGDVVRGNAHKHLGFSREDIHDNNTQIAELALISIRKNDFVLVPIISPYREDRKLAREIIGDQFIELFVFAPLDLCIRRDVKGLYKRALSGEIQNMIGVSSSHPY